MCGLLVADGLRVGVGRVGRALRQVNPDFQEACVTRATHRFNPIPYHASYFGQKLHIHQIEKLVMFGVTHICAIDGYLKNNVEIYRHLFR